jgi:23S rRNA (pseudouridine1915-N3)-methyltransferase
MQLLLVAVGRLKHPAIRSACEDFAERIRHYQRFEIREARDAGRSDREAADARRTEADALRRLVPPGGRTFALTRVGDAVSSEDLAARLVTWQEEARDVALLIGGAHGLDDRLLREAEGTISLSAMTLPHELARLIMLEQIYRACTIARGEPYHKSRRP